MRPLNGAKPLLAWPSLQHHKLNHVAHDLLKPKFVTSILKPYITQKLKNETTRLQFYQPSYAEEHTSTS